MSVDVVMFVVDHGFAGFVSLYILMQDVLVFCGKSFSPAMVQNSPR